MAKFHGKGAAGVPSVPKGLESTGLGRRFVHGRKRSMKRYWQDEAEDIDKKDMEKKQMILAFFVALKDMKLATVQDNRPRLF